MRKIVFISIGSLEKYLYDALCIDVFLQEGKDVVFLDLSSWFFGTEKKQKYNFVQSIDSFKNFEIAIQRHLDDETYFNIQIYYENRFFHLFRLLTKYHCRLCRFEIGYLPSVSPVNRIRNYLSNPLDMLIRIKEKVISFLVKKIGLVKLDFDFIFYAGSIALCVAHKKTRNTIAINHVDHEEYQKCAKYEKELKTIKHDYAVFLDIYLTRHEDIDYVATLRKIDHAVYIKTLNCFFDLLEKDLGLEVVIAMHPKADYAPYTFGNRKMVKNKTAELVYNSSLVISHHSAAISHAILSQKPTMLIVTSAMEDKYQLNIIPFMQALAQELDVPYLNIEKLDTVVMPQVNQKAYEKYKYSYLTSPQSENHSNKDIMRKFIRNSK